MMEKEMGIKSLKDLSKDHVQEFLLSMKEKRNWSASTFRNHRQNIASFCNWLYEEGFIKTNPANNIKKPKLPIHTPRYLSKEQLAKVEVAILRVRWPSNYIRIRNIAIYYTFLLSGLRLSELLLLRIEDINPLELVIRVQQGKGRKDREIPIHPKLYQVLTQFLESRDGLKHNSPYFFASEHSTGAVTPKTIHNAFRKTGKAAGVYFTPHQLRHTFAREAINKGLGLYQTKNILGHTDISTTQRYLSIAHDDLRKSFHGIDLYEL